MHKEEEPRLATQFQTTLSWTELPANSGFFYGNPEVSNPVFALYDQAFDQAEQEVDEIVGELSMEDFHMVLMSARRVGRIMGRQFPEPHQTQWVIEDVALVDNIVLPESFVKTHLHAVHSVVMAYQPIWEEFVKMAAGKTGDLNKDEIDIVAFHLVEDLIFWRWFPRDEHPARALSQHIAATLKHLHQESVRSIPEGISLDDVLLEKISDGIGGSLEDRLVEKESFLEQCQTLGMTPEEALSIIGSQDEPRSAMHAAGTRYYFPVPVSRPQAIWGFLAEISPQGRFAVLHNLGYLYPHESQKQVEKEIGLNPGHLKAILAQARKQIISLWHADHYESRMFSIESIRELIHEAETTGVVVYRFHNGRVDKPTSLRTRLRHIVEAQGPAVLDELSVDRASVARLVIQGYSAEEVASQLSMNPKTVRNHMSQAVLVLSRSMSV